MGTVLQNKNLEIHIDHPLENYNFSRFDWTGKITEVHFQGNSFTTTERTDDVDENLFGKGFYNEFGMDTALGFEEAEIGGWFHKIGVGLLRKDSNDYQFTKRYEIKPANFELKSEPGKLIIICSSDSVNGNAYVLKKEIVLANNGFSINYHLENTGEKNIITDEYVHNFMAINRELMGPDYILKFPFDLKPGLDGEVVNPGNVIKIGENEIGFNGTTLDQFFFSNLSGNKRIKPSWELINLNANIGIRERVSFETAKVNLWGWEHVISPELFFNIQIKPGETQGWSRHFEVFEHNPDD